MSDEKILAGLVILLLLLPAGNIDGNNESNPLNSLGVIELTPPDGLGATPESTYPKVDLPSSYRTHNWTSYNNEGSCVHASMYMLFHWQGQHEIAEWWKANHSGGASYHTLNQDFDNAGIDYAQTTSGDVEFLEKAIKTNRGAGVVVQGGAHMVILCHLDEKWAGILDNNDPNNIKWRSRESFIREWKNSYGWAVVPIVSNPPKRLL